MTKPRLTYFDNPRSRGEECRLALFLAGVDFEDNRLPRDAWPALKPTTPFGSLPTFEVEGKPAVSQSNAILGHIGRRYGLLPKDEWEALRLDSLLSACEDLRYAVNKTLGIQDPEELKRKRSRAHRGAHQDVGHRTWKNRSSGRFAGGPDISVADIKLFIVLGWLKGGVLDHVPTDVISGFPKLEKLHEAVKTHPKVVAWYARPRG